MPSDRPVPATSVPDLLHRLEEGVRSVQSSEDWRRLLMAQANFHDYSLGNVLLILAQRPDATRVAGFHTWLALDRHVRRGEHGIAILAPVHPRLTDEDRAERRRARHDIGVGGVDRQPTGFRVTHVFDVSQTEGQPLPDVRTLVPEMAGSSAAAEALLPRLQVLARDEGLALERVDRLPDGARGCYQPTRARILLAEGMAPDQEAKTLAHELAHHLLGHTSVGTRDHEAEEAAAEGVAFVVCARFGLDTSEYSFGYVASWSGRDDGAAVIRQVGSAIQRTAHGMIDRIDPPEREIEREEAREPVQARGRSR